MRIRGILIAATFTIAACGATPGVDYYSAADLQNAAQKLSAHAKSNSNSPSVDQLAKYARDYTLVVYRNASGSAEMHEHESDLYVVLDGEATLESGGKLMHQSTKSEGEFLGTGIWGGRSQRLNKGDVVHISPNIPHRLVIEAGHTFAYFVVKVKE